MATNVKQKKEDLISSNFRRGKQTFIIPLTFPDITVVRSDLERIGYGGDVWQLRVDMLQLPQSQTAISIPPQDYVSSQLKFLQQSSVLPIIFSIRTVSQGGNFPDEAAEQALALMVLAIQQGCDYIDVGACWPSDLIQEVERQKNGSKVIVSFHYSIGADKWLDTWHYKHARLKDFGDILQLSFPSTNINDSHDLALFIRDYRKVNTKPIITEGVGMGSQLSHIISPITFVTHPLVSSCSHPGQLSLAQVNQTLHLLGQIPRRLFFIFGNNISHSLSPTIHNTGFAELGLPHQYSIYQTPQIDDSVRRMIQRPDFGGASVTYPHKLNVKPLLDSISESATALGAVNTIIAEEGTSGRVLKGDNTDWLGILNCIQKSKLDGYMRAIVIGAGGAARAAVYAVQKRGCQRVALVNRTRSTAERLAADFPSLQIDIYDSLRYAPEADVIIGCIPADDIKDEDIPAHIFANGLGLVIEMSYRPPVSALMGVASRLDGWQVFNGIDVLKEQAYAQFQLWTGRCAPAMVIEEALKEKVNPKI